MKSKFRQRPVLLTLVLTLVQQIYSKNNRKKRIQFSKVKKEGLIKVSCPAWSSSIQFVVTIVGKYSPMTLDQMSRAPFVETSNLTTSKTVFYKRVRKHFALSFKWLGKKTAVKRNSEEVKLRQKSAMLLRALDKGMDFEKN